MSPSAVCASRGAIRRWPTPCWPARDASSGGSPSSVWRSCGATSRPAARATRSSPPRGLPDATPSAADEVEGADDEGGGEVEHALELHPEEGVARGQLCADVAGVEPVEDHIGRDQQEYAHQAVEAPSRFVDIDGTRTRLLECSQRAKAHNDAEEGDAHGGSEERPAPGSRAGDRADRAAVRQGLHHAPGRRGPAGGDRGHPDGRPVGMTAISSSGPDRKSTRLNSSHY